MLGLSFDSLVWLVFSVNTIALGSAWLARLGEGSHNQSLCHALFFCCLALAGLATLVALNLGPAAWLLSGGMLATTALAAIYDPCHAHGAWSGGRV